MTKGLARLVQICVYQGENKVQVGVLIYSEITDSSRPPEVSPLMDA